jgi:cyclase
MPNRYSALRRSIACALGAVIALAFAPAATAQMDFSKVEVRAQQLGETTWMLSGAGGNVGLSVGPDAVFIIDNDFTQVTPKIRDAIAKITPKPVGFVLNTHYHWDHSGGNELFGSAGALIVAHDNVRRRMSTDQLINFAGRASTQKASPKAALPVVTVPGSVRLHINGDEVHAFHVPAAHTDGDLIVHFVKSNVVHMGDNYFNGMYPFIDASSGGSADGVIAAADRVLALADERTKIIPGHGPLASKADLQGYRDMLATVTQRIRELRRAGRTDAEIRDAKPAAEFDARLGGGFIKADAFVQMMLGVIPK